MHYKTGKRVSFSSIQAKHIRANKKAVVNPLMTGAEVQMAHRIGSPLYATPTAAAGIITEVTPEYIIGEYANGETVQSKLGRVFTKAAGKTVPHMLVTDMKKGQRFKEGHVIAWNSGFFERWLLEPSQVILKTTMLATTALYEVQQTYEDASMISDSFSENQTYDKTEVRNVLLNSEQTVSDMVKVGDVVDSQDTLMFVGDGTIADDAEVFSEQTKALLEGLSTITPKADMSGVVERIEVHYNGDLEDMSKSIAKLVKRYNRQLSSERKAEGLPEVTASVDGFSRVNGQNLDINQVLISVYITKEVKVGMGSKGSFCNQLKTVYSGRLVGTNKTADDTPLDAAFSFVAVNNRIVESPTAIGSTILVLQAITKEWTK